MTKLLVCHPEKGGGGRGRGQCTVAVQNYRSLDTRQYTAEAHPREKYIKKSHHQGAVQQQSHHQGAVQNQSHHQGGHVGATWEYKRRPTPGSTKAVQKDEALLQGAVRKRESPQGKTHSTTKCQEASSQKGEHHVAVQRFEKGEEDEAQNEDGDVDEGEVPDA